MKGMPEYKMDFMSVQEEDKNHLKNRKKEATIFCTYVSYLLKMNIFEWFYSWLGSD